MNREDLEHIIRASADVTQQYEFIILGSQSLLGPVPCPEEIFKVSAEADIYPLHAPEMADHIDGAIGEGSPFHEFHGYYAQGVGPDTAILAAGWMDRRIGCRTRTPMAAWGTAWMWWISFWPRRRRPGRRTGFSVSRSSNTAT